MPTKARKEREKLAAAKEMEFDKLLGEIPEYLRTEDFGDLTRLYADFNPPPLSLYPVDEDGVQYRDDKVTNALDRGNQGRHETKLENIEILKKAFPTLWGKRGSAKIIAAETERLLGVSLSVRTIQEYHRLDRKEN